MKKVVVGTMLLATMYTPCALAEWPESFTADDFTAIAESRGVEDAVKESLKNGVGIQDIMSIGKQAGEVESTSLIKALYCYGGSSSAIVQAASDEGVPTSAVVAGYKKSVGECGPAVAKTFNPLSNTRNMVGGGTPTMNGSGQGGPPPDVGGPPPGAGNGGPGGGQPATPHRFN